MKIVSESTLRKRAVHLRRGSGASGKRLRYDPVISRTKSKSTYKNEDFVKPFYSRKTKHMAWHRNLAKAIAN